MFGVGLVLGDGALACVDAEGTEGGLDLVDAVFGGEEFGVHAHAGVGAVVVFVDGDAAEGGVEHDVLLVGLDYAVGGAGGCVFDGLCHFFDHGFCLRVVDLCETCGGGCCNHHQREHYFFHCLLFFDLYFVAVLMTMQK